MSWRIFDITAAAVDQKLRAMGTGHQAHRIPAPSKDSEVVREMIKDTIKRNAPLRRQSQRCQSQTGKHLEAVRDALVLDTKQGLCFWAGLRFAIAMLCRISEWTVNEGHTLSWNPNTFFGEDRHPMEVTSAEDMKWR